MKVKRGYRRPNSKRMSRKIVRSGSVIHSRNRLLENTPRGGIRL